MEALDRRRLRPIEHPGLIRLGGPRDGAYIVPETLVRCARVLVSLGMKEDWSFDRAFVRLNPAARVIAVDYSVGRRWFARRIATSLAAMIGCAFAPDRRRLRKSVATLRTAVDYFRFFGRRHRHIRKRVSASGGASDIGLGTLFDLAGAGDAHDVFLKVDIEGSEYALIPAILDRERAIGCLVVEFHRLGRHTATFNRAIERLLERFRIVHIHGNNYSAYDASTDFPDAVEITFVNAGLLGDPPTPSVRTFPRADLDRPNRRGRPDYHLHFD